MRENLRRCLLAAVLLCGMPYADASDISPAAQRLIQVIDGLDVEHHWPAGEHVAWETGMPDGKAESGLGKHTHCSAFVAAAAKRVGIYVLRPPEHKQSGGSNYRSVALRIGFAGHPAAWGRREVRFYAHPVDATALGD